MKFSDGMFLKKLSATHPMSQKYQVKVIRGDKYGRVTEEEYSGMDLDEAVNVFLRSGVQVSAPPQIAAAGAGIYVMISYDEQPKASGVNDHDRAQRSLTKKDAQLYEQNNRAECGRQHLPYDADGIHIRDLRDKLLFKQ